MSSLPSARPARLLFLLAIWIVPEERFVETRPLQLPVIRCHQVGIDPVIDLLIEKHGAATGIDCQYPSRMPARGPGECKPAASLLLACTTAFFEGYRAAGDSFFAYPDFFTFQLHGPVASYGSFDIWPNHKSVAVEAAALRDAVTDRAIDVLIIPQDWTGTGELNPVQQAALWQRVITDREVLGQSVVPHDYIVL